MSQLIHLRLQEGYFLGGINELAIILVHIFLQLQVCVFQKGLQEENILVTMN